MLLTSSVKEKLEIFKSHSGHGEVSVQRSPTPSLPKPLSPLLLTPLEFFLAMRKAWLFSFRVKDVYGL